ncbi:hypothetical protein kuro4_19500 [Gelria sp. Kuro-4]|nr:hypothetical protein kuro4_19500 [Gelria sp. Kuro-4]
MYSSSRRTSKTPGGSNSTNIKVKFAVFREWRHKPAPLFFSLVAKAKRASRFIGATP